MLNKIKLFFKGKLFAPLVFLLSFVYFAAFRYFMIPAGDDYFWGGAQGKYLILHGFYGPQATYGGSSNGRFLGNTLEILSMHSITIATVSYGVFFTLLLWAMWRLAGKSISSLLLSLAFIFTLQGAYINNVLAWNAGFVNYVPPIALILTYLVIVEYGQKKDLHWTFALLTLFIGSIAGLFTETLNLGQVCLAVLIILYFRKKTKLYHVTYFIGTLISAAIMFLHPSYHEKSTYRLTTFDPAEIWRLYKIMTHYWLISFNIVLLVAILLAIITLTLKSDFSKLQKTITAGISALFLLYYAAITVYFRKYPKDDMFSFNSAIFPNKVAVIDSVMSLLLIVFIGYCIFLFYKTDAKMWLYFLMTGIVSGQLLFVASPVNSRGYFAAYVFMYLIATRFVIDAFSKIKFVNWLLLIAVLFMGVSFQSMIYTNYQVNLERVSDPQFYNGKAGLTKHVPYRQFVGTNDLLNQQNTTYWKHYVEEGNYHLPIKQVFDILNHESK